MHLGDRSNDKLADMAFRRFRLPRLPAWRSWALGTGILVGLGFATALYSYAALIAVGIAGYALLLARAGVWRTMVCTSIVVSLLRSGPTMAMFGESTWYVLQFAPVAIAIVALLVQKPGALRPQDRAFLTFLGLFAVAAVATTATSIAPSSTLSQALLLCFMTVFLGLTFTRRWTDAASIRLDVELIFFLLVGVQAIGLVASLTFGAWALDPDYGRFRGLFSNANYAGVMSAVAVSIGVYLLRDSLKRKVFVSLGIVVLVTTMLMSGSRGALVAAAAGALVLFFSSAGRKIAIRTLGAGALTVLFVVLIRPDVLGLIDKFFLRDPTVSNDISSGRFGIYADLLEQLARSPFTGTGYRTIELLTETGGAAGHNIYLSVLTETGFLGFTVFLGLIVCVIAASRAEKRRRPLIGVVVTIAIVELTESSLYGWGGPTALVFWILIVAFAAHGRVNVGELDPPSNRIRGVRSTHNVRHSPPRMAALN